MAVRERKDIWKLTFTPVDREGARLLYGPPVADFEMIRP